MLKKKKTKSRLSKKIDQIMFFLDPYFDWWEHSKLKQVGIGLGRIAMCSDIVTDALVTHDLWRTQKERPLLWLMGIFFLCLQYVVIWGVLFKPLYRLSSSKTVFGLKPTVFSFTLVYVLIGLPCIVCMDLVLFSVYLFSELEDQTFLIYYERMRVLCETLLEALPESMFQLYVWKTGLLDSEDMDPNILYVSIGISCGSLLKCLYLVWDGAQKRNVRMQEHAWQILTLGAGFTPFISGIRKGKLVVASYDSLQLVPNDLKRIMWALGSKKVRTLKPDFW